MKNALRCLVNIFYIQKKTTMFGRTLKKSEFFHVECLKIFEDFLYKLSYKASIEQ